jgi:hypothetical protein
MLASQSTHQGQITHIPIAKSRSDVGMSGWLGGVMSGGSWDVATNLTRAFSGQKNAIP